MGDVDETAKLWKVNRTIHELVKDRVSIADSPTLLNLITWLDVGLLGIRR